jgi:hypothetical protein
MVDEMLMVEKKKEMWFLIYTILDIHNSDIHKAG